MAKVKVLVLCSDYPPVNSIGAQRPYSWWKYFQKHDAEITIITKQWDVNKNYSREEFVQDAWHGETLIEETEEGKIIRIPQTLILPEKMILKHGMNKRVIQRRSLTFLYRVLSYSRARYDKHYSIYLAAKDELSKENYDFVVTTGRPFILFRYGHLLKKDFNFKFIADYRDGWYHNHVSSLAKGLLNKFLRRFELKYEKKFLQKADYISTVDTYLGSKLQKMHNKPLMIVHNGFWEFAKTDVKPEGQELVLTHTGTLTPGQRAEFLLDAVSELVEEKKVKQGDIKIQFIGLDYFPEQSKRIKTYRKNLSELVVTTARIPREDALTENCKSDFLLSFSEADYKAIFAKTFDYLSTKRPILLLPDDESMLSEFVQKTNCGFSFKAKEELKTFLLEKIEQKKAGLLNQTMEINEEAALFYTREKQAESFVQQLIKAKNNTD
jgi:hypothetical protein